MSRKPSCPVCSSVSLTIHQEVRSFRTVRGEEILYPAEYSRCAQCGEEFFTSQQSRAATRALVGIERQRGGRLTPNEIRAIRTNYGVTQEQMQRIVRVGKKAWGRWENGLVCQSRSADQLLREIRDSPSMFRRLAEQAGVSLPAPAAEDVWSSFDFPFKVSDSSFVVTVSSVVPTRPRMGPMPPAEVEYGTIDWQEVFAPTCLDEITTGARVNQTDGSASPGFMLAA